MRASRHAVVVALFLLGILLSVPARLCAADGDILPFKATERTLPNGLHVIVIPTGFPNLVSIDIPVQVGSRNEVEAGKSGFAHFFEHLMFRGTPATPPERYRAIMGAAGARDNASTGDDRTHYYATFAKEHLEPLLAVYGDMFQHLDYAEADFKTEALAILGEYNKNSADPIRKLLEVQRDRFYQVHPYKHTTMGFIADIEKMPGEYAYSKLFFERWYRPQYATVIVAGDVTPGEVLPLVEKYFGAWTAGTTAPPEIPKEPPPAGPRYAHIPWSSPTLPYVSVGFPGPAFDEDRKDSAAVEMIAALYFGPTSALYKRLVVAEQKVDSLMVDVPAGADASLFTILARVKVPADAVYVRDQMLATVAAARASMVPPSVLADAKSHERYAFARTLDSTERIASVVSSYGAHRRSYETVNNHYRRLDALTPRDVQDAARTYFTDAGLIVTTLSKEPLPEGIDRLPALDAVKASVAFAPEPQVTQPPGTGGGPGGMPSQGRPPVRLVIQKSVLPQLDIKLLFTVGSAHDPAGKEGLAALTAAMMAEAGSAAMTIDQIHAVLYPMAGSWGESVDKEMTTFTGSIHRDHWTTFLGTVLPQLLNGGFRVEDFTRLKAAQKNALVQDLRSDNEEELGKERLQTNIFRGTPYGHVALGTVAGLDAVTLDDVKRFARKMYTHANLTVGVNGDAPNRMVAGLQSALRALPAGPRAARVVVEGRRPSGLEVEIIEKDTRATAISLGFPIAVNRAHPDFAAMTVARSWLGEHRIQSGRLFQRIREVRGMNYGDYAYIEAFPRGMFQFFPDPNLARQRQIFEIWIRPVVPANAHMALRIAVNELAQLIQRGLTQADFETTRNYLLNNVYVMTARQDQQLGYALDSRWYGLGEFTSFMRGALRALTLEQVNAAVRKHLTSEHLSIVCVTRDAASLKQALVSDSFSPIRYDGEKPPELLAEDRVIGGLKLNVSEASVRITKVEDVFAR